MEDYTYHFNGSGDRVLGAHMLEICESIAVGKPRLEVLPLSIGGKADPLRLIGEGEGVHWPDLDEDISVENLILRKPSGESQKSFRKWLEARKKTART